jgi:hypothetical protein
LAFDLTFSTSQSDSPNFLAALQDVINSDIGLCFARCQLLVKRDVQ